MQYKTTDILGLPFLAVTQAQFIQMLIRDAEKQQKKFVITANPEMIMFTRQDEEFQRISKEANYIVADGIGVIVAAKKLNKTLPERVTGYDTMVGILKAANEFKLKAYFLGATPEVSKKLANVLSTQYPNLIIAGCKHGYFTAEESEFIAQEIKASRADFIFVGLGGMKQEKWIAKYFNLFDKGVFMGVGGSFDVISGVEKRASYLWIRMNLEWLYRFLKHPSRLRRYLALPRFMFLVRRETKKYR